MLQERSQLEDFPLPKSEAREFLQQSIPCMASVVVAYQAAIQPIANAVVEERRQEEYNARAKRAEILVQPNMPKHQTHERFMRAASDAYGGVQMPKSMIDRMRAASRAVASGHTRMGSYPAQVRPRPRRLRRVGSHEGPVYTTAPLRTTLACAGCRCVSGPPRSDQDGLYTGMQLVRHGAVA